MIRFAHPCGAALQAVYLCFAPVPAVRDRVAQEVVRLLLQPIFEPLFHDCSYGFRPGRNCHQAIQAALDLHSKGHRFVLDADIKGFFDQIGHSVIMRAVAQEIADGNILGIIEKFLRAGVMEDGVFKPTNIGTPQGGVISPLLANIALNRLDHALEEAGYRFVRYADDFLVICSSKTQAEEALAFVERILKDLGLQLNSEKTKVTSFKEGYAFLGFVLKPTSRKMREKSERKFKDKIRQLTKRKENFESQKVIEKLNRVIRGTGGYFGAEFATSSYQFRRLDEWIRMRLRCMKFKRKSDFNNHRMKTKSFDELGLLHLQSYA